VQQLIREEQINSVLGVLIPVIIAIAVAGIVIWKIKRKKN